MRVGAGVHGWCTGLGDTRNTHLGVCYPAGFHVFLVCRYLALGAPWYLARGWAVAGSGWSLLSIPVPHTPMLSHSGSRGWLAGWARCSCRMAPADLRLLRLAARCAAGAATCRGSSTASMPACALRSFSASSEVGPAPTPASPVWALSSASVLCPLQSRTSSPCRVVYQAKLNPPPVASGCLPLCSLSLRSCLGPVLGVTSSFLSCGIVW